MSGPVFRGVRAVLFDLDGTLIDSAPDLGAAADTMRTRRGLAPLSLDRYRPMAGAGARGMLKVAFEITPEHPGYELLKEEFLGIYETCLLQRTQAFDTVEQLLETLVRGGVQWGVVTNKAERFTIPLTRAMALFQSASTIISGDTTPHAKPHPAPLLEAARRMDLQPADCIYVGDDARDITAGRAAGMSTVAARYGYLGLHANVSEWGADAEVHTPMQLLKMLELP